RRPAEMPFDLARIFAAQTCATNAERSTQHPYAELRTERPRYNGAMYKPQFISLIVTAALIADWFMLRDRSAIGTVTLCGVGRNDGLPQCCWAKRPDRQKVHRHGFSLLLTIRLP
ncbi:MAG TPA: hypothetical protein VHD56_01065, partial [Tepidisphaeraceae bacterium]|nr:hypothetical protein [Tepidisphaeraceae bacterium]